MLSFRRQNSRDFLWIGAGQQITSAVGATYLVAIGRNLLYLDAGFVPGQRLHAVYGVRAATPAARAGAQSAANAVRLEKQLASQAQMGEVGQVMAGAGSRTVFRDAQRIAQQFGGNAADWVKKTSSSHLSRDGTRFETHWVENIRTGQRVEFKTKFPGGD
jgi:hypothetical protein